MGNIPTTQMKASIILLLVPALLLSGEGEPRADQRLADAALEELMINLEISSVSSKQRKLSGATSLPEALRLAPGLQVARIDSGKWAVSSRGLNGRFANKILALMRRIVAPGTDVLTGFGVSRAPRHQVQTHWAWDVARGVAFEAFAYGIAATSGGRVPGYVRADVRLAHNFGEHGELSVGGHNLPDSRHREFPPEDFVLSQEVRRSAYVRFTGRF